MQNQSLQGNYSETDQWEKYIQYTNEKKLILDKILQIAKPKREWSFLDVGAGTGEITIPLSQLIGKTTIVEESKQQIEKLLRKNRFLDVYNKKFEYVILARNFNLVLMSLVLMHIEDWKKTIEKLLACTKPEGYMFIVHHRESGDLRDLLSTFRPMINGREEEKRGRFENIQQIIQELGEKPNVEEINATLTIPSVKEAVNLCEFLFHKPVKEFSNQIISRLEEYFESKQQRGKVVLSAHYGIIWVKKSGVLYKV